MTGAAVAAHSHESKHNFLIKVARRLYQKRHPMAAVERGHKGGYNGCFHLIVHEALVFNF